MTAREWHLVRRPGAQASPDDFALAGVDPPEPGPEQVVVPDTHLPVEAYLGPLGATGLTARLGVELAAVRPVGLPRSGSATGGKVVARV